jgi:hypothetical protein
MDSGQRSSPDSGEAREISASADPAAGSCSPAPKIPAPARKSSLISGATAQVGFDISLASKENAMAKGQEKGNKEKKKPKADKNASKSGGQSAYQQSKGGKK